MIWVNVHTDPHGLTLYPRQKKTQHNRLHIGHIVGDSKWPSYNMITNFSMTHKAKGSQYKDTVLPVYDSHYEDKTVSRPSYIYNGRPKHVKTVFTLKLAKDS